MKIDRTKRIPYKLGHPVGELGRQGFGEAEDLDESWISQAGAGLETSFPTGEISPQLNPPRRLIA